MALTNLVTSLVLDVYDHDTTPTSVKAIALDKQIRFIKATLTYRGADYPVDENAAVTLTVIRPDKTGVQVTGSVVDVDNADRTGTIKGVYAELSQTALAVKGNLKAQFMVSVGDQILRTEIFTVKNGEALDADVSEWAGEYQGYNLDELVQNVNSAVATVEEMQSDVTDLKEGFRNNTFDIIQNVGGYKAKTHNGIVFSVSDDGNYCVANGTATSNAFSNIFASTTSLPTGVHPGSNVRFYVTTTDNAKYRVVYACYNANGETTGGWHYLGNKDGEVHTIPNDAVGIVIRLQVESGTTLSDALIHAEIYPEVYDNHAYAEFKRNIDSSNAGLNNIIIRDRMESNSIIGENLLLNSTAVSKTHNGVTFTRNSDGSYTVRGTSVNNTAFIDLYISISEIPSWLKYNTQYYVQFSGTQVNLVVYAIDTQGSPSETCYSGNWSGSFYISSKYVGLIIRLTVAAGKTVNETVYPIITDTIPYKFLSDNMRRLVNGNYGYRRRLTTLSNVEQSNPKDVSPGSLIKITGLSDSSNVLVCGKNLYRNPHELSTYTTKNVTYTYDESNGTITATSTGATGATVYPNYITTLNGIGWAGLFKFSLKSDAIVTFSDNASVEQFLYNKLFMQVGDGTNLIALHGHNLTMKCLANVEYGVRLYVEEGFSGTVVFKPQIEINGYSTDFEPFSGIYNDGNGNKIVINNQNGSADAVMIPGNVATVISYDTNVSVTYLKQDRIDVSYNSAVKVKHDIAKKPLMLSFLDDDTVNLTYVELFHDTLVELGAIGNYATITNHLLSSNELQDKLLEYETEGFGIVCHCSNQAGTATDYFRPYEDRDIDEVRQNMITAVRYIKEAGFISGNIWATPYGVNDSQIQELAKSLGFRGLISGMNYTPVFGNITSKYNIPRYSIDVSNDITKAGMDACVTNGGWIIVTSHTYNWGNNVQVYKQKIGELITYANSIGMKIVNIEEGFRTFFDCLSN